MSDKLKAADFTLKEENDNFKQAVIERKNVTTEFTLELVEEHKQDLEKLEKELTSQISVCEATVDNIHRNHEWLKDIEEEKLHHAWMLKENKDVINNAKPKLEQVQDQLKQYKALEDLIYKKFGFVESDTATSIDPKDLEDEQG